MTQPQDRFEALRDKRQWIIIRKETDYWQRFWQAYREGFFRCDAAQTLRQL